MKKLVILGAGESGVGAALLGKKCGYEVFVSDKSPIKENFVAELEAAQIPYESGSHTEGVILAADVIMKSPGIPDKAPIVKAALERGIEVISEIELGFRHTKKKIVGITGSNGKTTTTSLVYHLMKTAGLKVEVGGNIGYSFARLVAEEDTLQNDWYVLEISSFQLDGTTSFRPDIALLLNITPDHLDRYDYKMENYIASKFKIMANQTENDVFIHNSDDQNIMGYWAMNDADLPMPMSFQISQNTFKNDPTEAIDAIMPNFTEGGYEFITHGFSMSQSALKGPHNYFNAQCAVIAAQLAGASQEKIQEGLNTFQAVPHRLEFVAEIGGISFVNDSKATNVDSVFWALSAMKNPTVLILGGQDKGNDYNQIANLVDEKCFAVVALGVDNQKIMDFFKTPHNTKSMSEAVHKAYEMAQQFVQYQTDNPDNGIPNKVTILLSPACASFDLFKNYEDRGAQFRWVVLEIV